MRLERLLCIVDKEPVFSTGLLMAGRVDSDDIHKQLSRWTASGRLYQLRRGLYTLAPPYQRVKPHPFLIANHMVAGSYVSCESALAFFGLIPEFVPVTTSVTGSRSGEWTTDLGTYAFRHVRPQLLFGYQLIELGEDQRALVAGRVKALLDLIYLRPGGDSLEYLSELRLQNLERLDLAVLRSIADRMDSPRLRRAANRVARLARAEHEEYESL